MNAVKVRPKFVAKVLSGGTVLSLIFIDEGDTMRIRSLHWLSLLMLVLLALTACDSPATTSPQPTAGPTETRVAETPSPTETVIATLAPTETPTPLPLDLADAGIAYLDIEHHLWLMNADGTAHRQLTKSGAAMSPTWSPNGQTLVYVYYKDANDLSQGQAWLYDMQQGEARPIGPTLKFLTNLSWSPDGRYLILDVGTGISRSLHVLETATGEVVHHLTSMFNYGWAPDSNALVLGQRQPLDEPISYELRDSMSLSVWEVGAAEPQIILQGNAEVLYFPTSPLGHGWLPDGRILYTRLDWDEAAQSGDKSLWTVTWEDGVLGEPQPAADIPLRYNLNAVQERIEETVNVAVTGFISWAPDDRHMVFQAGMHPDYGIYLLDWESDDLPRRLADGISPAWRPVPVTAMPAPTPSPTAEPTSFEVDGRIVFADQGDVFVINADGTQRTQLTEAGLNISPACSPDGQHITFASDRDGNWEIYVMKANGSEQTRLTDNAADDADPAWSPDGIRIVFVSTRDGNSEIYVMNADGSAQERLMNTSAADGSPDWSPDGKKIAFNSYRDGRWQIYVMSIDGAEQTSLATGLGGHDHAPAWSPDGSLIAFWSFPKGENDAEIYVMNADGSGVIKLTDNLKTENSPANDYAPVWSPDGRQIAFYSDRKGNFEVYVMRSDGTEQIRLVEGSTPCWLP